jgi:squalene-hopene/tetraprenyl-beta-curcumene cyclase
LAEPERNALDTTIARATRALLAAQDDRGCWRDFPQVGPGSDEWVTAYVGSTLASVPDESARAAAERAWTTLAARRRWSGGWGYMPSHPADADSTVCALRLAQELARDRTLRAWRARVFLRRHQTADGGISTYRWPRRMAWSTGLRETFAGWCSAHVCVSANAAHLDRFGGRSRLFAFLRSHQLPDGSWRAYWWYDEREYATALAAVALAASPDPRDAAVVQRAIEWARTAADHTPVVTTAACPAGSAFAMALRLRVLLLGRADDVRRAAQRTSIAWLAETQRADGTWPASAWLRFPPTEVVDATTIPEWHVGEMVRAGVMLDDFGLFTTATVLTTLLEVRATLHGERRS